MRAFVGTCISTYIHTCKYAFSNISRRALQAMVMLEKCLKVNPRHSWAACDLAVIMHNVEKKSDKAEELLLDVIEKDPTCANAFCNRGFPTLSPPPPPPLPSDIFLSPIHASSRAFWL